MNPFDLRGPEFLLFYTVLASVVILVLVALRRQNEAGFLSTPPLDDPYLIAFLQGGEGEALRVVTMSLIDRGLLVVKSSGSPTSWAERKNRLEIANPLAMHIVKRPIEKEVLEAFNAENDVETVLDGLEARGVCDYYEKTLTQMGLLPDERIKQARRVRYQIAVGVLVGVALLKIFIALSRGRTNIIFLILLALLSVIVTTKVSNPFRTLRGESLLAEVRSLFSSLRDRKNSLLPGGATTELAWLASVFGLAAVSPVLFPHVDLLRSKRKAGWSSSSDFFSSSCGSGCGGGCGGGGCGGGCGGCGG